MVSESKMTVFIPWQAEIDLHMRDNVDDDDLFLLFRELDDQETSLSYDFQQFKKNTADPVWTLR